MTPQHLAAINGDAETLRLLLAAGSDPNAALHLAVGGRASEPIITYLVKEAGTDPSIRNAKDQTVLALAKAKRDSAAVVALLESLGVSDSAVAATAGGDE